MAVKTWFGGAWLAATTGAACSGGDLAWDPCEARVPGGEAGECAVAEVPVRWSEPEGSTIEVAVKRFLTDRPQGQAWILDGGPGGNGWPFESSDSIGTGRSLVDHLQERGWDVYIPSHRGTGLSTALDCSPYLDWDSAAGPMLSSEEAGPCAQQLLAEWGDDLAGFNSVDAAQDVLSLASAVRAVDGGRQVIYSTSYGGYWSQRMMKLDPNFWDGIVLDSPLILGADVEHTDQYAGRAVERLFSEVCGADPACTAMLGDDPLQTALDVLAGLDGGTGCPGVAGLGLDAAAVVDILQLMVGSFTESQVMAPPLIHRLDRCSASDVAELEHMVAFLDSVSGGTYGYASGSPAPTDEGTTYDPAVSFFDAALSNNVIALDLWPVELDVDALETETLAEPFARFDRGFATMLGEWPRPADYQRDDALPTTDGPILVTQGGLDLATPPEWSAALAAQLDGPGQWRVVFPVAGHGTPLWTLEASDATSCALSVQLAFLDDPKTDPTLDCIEDRLDFSGDAVGELAAEVYGTTSLWGSPDR